MSVHLKPEEIEAESFRIIDSEAGEHGWSPQDWPIVRRLIHTSADFDYIKTLVISADAVKSAQAAFAAGKGVVTDTNMALAGISKPNLAKYSCGIACHVADADVAAKAKESDSTRSIAAMSKAVATGTNGIFVIGNAPTALFELLRQVKEEGLRPDLIVGLPVGFVGAAESKEELIAVATEYGIPFITNRGRKGGSNVAAAVMNALLILALEQKGA
ncbi:MAG: precorrin-8X methylmutase [Deltaproteobacteria bacterium HGW-Deltaproteobacteria-23]|jgi:precorrin-8X/cobalt-precorrin-8 methylmutase|nr:MAG: precorrin-8X methylmutase [Deltaproteobacteria bacterium HGW-Deltaproteobacteria-23]